MKQLFVLLAAVGLLAGCSGESPTNSAQTDDAALQPALETDQALQPFATRPHHGVGAAATTYEIIIENLTPKTAPGASQPFSPPILATHQKRMHIFQVGRYASPELAQVAEDAQNGPMVERLQNSHRVFDVVEGDGVILPGGEARFEIKTATQMRRLSLAFMLVNTNDGFGGLDGVKLPRRGEETYYIHAYDAGSEQNSESASDIPGPCCGSPGEGTATHERIVLHAGIQGNGDLDPDVYGWSEPVAKLTVRRVNPTYEVTLVNLTPATVEGGSQVFSHPTLATHNPSLRMFRVGSYASDELGIIAEDGDAGPMLRLLQASDKVHEVLVGGDPVVPGASATYRLETARGQSHLSVAFMLVNTNDGFSGIDRLRLCQGGSESYYLRAYDAGTEPNTELAADIPGPCCGSHFVGPDEHRRIQRHPGILGVGDLAPEDYGWNEPVAKLTVTRVR